LKSLQPATTFFSHEVAGVREVLEASVGTSRAG
jgi:hypothetical protein